MSIILSSDEIHALTGYKVASKQLQALQKMGFYRARVSPIGNVVLEREHYQAVAAGYQPAAANSAAYRPRVRG
ncbi:DUF4224 domain-containing protein [Ramlibacter sp. MAHUQ-53]|uniref:DUF4224 domain-containing protein n=1 Tax=unclassified Ramlibacter TaxID=2617605 RepID=UPI003629DB31